ncbi:uncharacterized protein LOC124421006 isoform X2 [Lucilia cuprina]|uniref:uncharacterized protein LOC124421006 isoform X2 n=1 Tax=Lucilia cuprina TaxID=7375 RepID=UPI001F058D1A|nr:uncharacterized protein LOC124421006 isoform X2 [Lucilia cuprina]
MKCWGRSTLGVVVGGINVLFYIICVVNVILAILDINGEEQRSRYKHDTLAMYNALFATLFVFFLLMILLSSLLIVGIIKRRHKLMLPWLIVTGILLVLNCLRLAFNVIFGIIVESHVTSVLITFIVALAVIVSLWWAIYILYGEIRKDSNGKSGRCIKQTDKKMRL